MVVLAVRTVSSRFGAPSGVAVDGGGNVIVTERHGIYKITPKGEHSFLAGNLNYQCAHEGGYQDGELKWAMLDEPSGVAVDRHGNIIVADSKNRCIRCVNEVVTPRMILNNNFSQHSSTFASDLQHHLLDPGSFHDVCFVVEQERVHAHRGLLSARSEYFRSNVMIIRQILMPVS
jgi:hypothetical protein